MIQLLGEEEMINVSEYRKKGKYTQHQEEGIVNKILEVLDIKNGWCMEVGGWDGVHYSNIFHLVQQGWAALYIEPDYKKYEELVTNMQLFSEVYCSNDRLSLADGERIDQVLSQYPIPEDFDFLSFDIDSNDYYILKDMNKYKPKVVVAEYNSNWFGDMTITYDRDQEWPGTQYYGLSGTLLQKLMTKKGYDLVGIEKYHNLFFVRSDLNNGKFQTLDLTKEPIHISEHHHPEMTQEQKEKLVTIEEI